MSYLIGKNFTINVNLERHFYKSYYLILGQFQNKNQSSDNWDIAHN